MSQPIIFYSWQSDLPRSTTRDVIRDATATAIAKLANGIAVQDSPRLDSDTLGRAGTPAITETIFHKIRHSAVFVGDVTIIGQTQPREGQKPKKLSNPNVLLELGYAAALIGWDRIILVMNKHYASPESLPFDLRFRRFPFTFDLGPKTDRRPATIEYLATSLEGAIATCLAAEYTRVDDVLSRLSSFTRSFVVQFGAKSLFWETNKDNVILSRLDLAISQLLELGVILSVKTASDPGLAYTWTYLGRQCAIRLGVPQVALDDANIPERPPHVPVDLSSYEAISDASGEIPFQVRFTDDGLN